MENENKFNFEDYQDPTGEYSNKSLKFATWYVKNKEMIKKISIIFLILLDVILLSISIFGFSRYFFYDVFIIDNNINYSINEGIDFDELRYKYEPIDLILKDNKIFNSTKDSYDLATKVFNPNERFLAEVEYRFVFSSGITENKVEKILPGEERYFIFYGYKSTNRPNNFKIEILNIKWTRINNHEIKNIEDYKDQRIMFEVSSVDFTKNDNLKNSFSRFYITNNSIFSFREVNFNALFYSNNSLVGISPIFVEDFLAQDRKKIEITSFNINNIDNIKVETVLDVFDNSEYLDY